MNKRFLSAFGATVLATIATVSVTGCVAFYDKVADTLLANEVRLDDSEAPHTAYAIPASADGVQLIGGQGMGLSCSLPRGAQALAFARKATQAPIALQMRQACAFHDYCYRHGNATYGYSQADCDFMLQQQAFRLCKLVNKEATVGECETNARKVTLGVRIGGFGSFKRARALKDEEASTFMEFDPYPVRAGSYQVVRIADAPRQWVRDGLLPRAAYRFDIRPSGSLVHVLGWKGTGDMVCTSFALPASYHAMNGPPMVVREAEGGEDWFVWWRRATLTATHGHFALLPPGRANRQDWVTSLGGFTSHLEPGQCEPKALWGTDGDAAGAPPLAFATGNFDREFSELHAVYGANKPGTLRLMGLMTSPCEGSLCMLDVEIDTARRTFRDPPMGYRAIRRDGSGSESGESVDRYRNFVVAPIVVADEDRPSLIWMRRGANNGDGYETGAMVNRFSIGKTREDPAVDLGEMALTDFPETMEPAFVINAASAAPTFVSLVAVNEGFTLLTRTAAPKGEQSKASGLECFKNADASWLLRPPALVPDRSDERRNYIVFSRVRFKSADSKAFEPAAALEVAVATLDGTECSGVQVAAFPDFFEGFAETDELAAAAAVARDASDANVNKAKIAFGRFAERVRGGQMVLADITGDGVPDLVQIAMMRTLQLRAALLVGSIQASGLRFCEFPRDGERPRMGFSESTCSVGRSIAGEHAMR